jgi:hypothetical protein
MTKVTIQISGDVSYAIVGTNQQAEVLGMFTNDLMRLQEGIIPSCAQVIRGEFTDDEIEDLYTLDRAYQASRYYLGLSSCDRYCFDDNISEQMKFNIRSIWGDNVIFIHPMHYYELTELEPDTHPIFFDHFD